jgi:hypothetical protein
MNHTLIDPVSPTRNVKMASTRVGISAVIALTLIGTLSSCTGSHDSKSGSSATALSSAPTAARSGTATPLPSNVKAATSVPTKVANDVSLRKNVAITSCAAGKAGGWSASGTVNNPAASAADYTITVFFTTTSATVISTAQTKVTVQPGAKVTWNATKTFTAPKKMLCVLRGVG